MHVIFEDEVLKISGREASPAAGGSTLLSFTGIGHGMGGVDVQKVEFFGAGRKFDNMLFITDKTRSWGNLLDFEQIATRLRPFTETSQTYAIWQQYGWVSRDRHVPLFTH